MQTVDVGRVKATRSAYDHAWAVSRGVGRNTHSVTGPRISINIVSSDTRRTRATALPMVASAAVLFRELDPADD